jgi:hypothetical protein
MDTSPQAADESVEAPELSVEELDAVTGGNRLHRAIEQGQRFAPGV